MSCPGGLDPSPKEILLDSYKRNKMNKRKIPPVFFILYSPLFRKKKSWLRLGVKLIPEVLLLIFAFGFV